MMGKKAGAKLVDAAAEARDEALIEIGREAAERKQARVQKARRRTAGKAALVAVAAGAAITAGAVALRRRRMQQKVDGTVNLSGKPEQGDDEG